MKNQNRNEFCVYIGPSVRGLIQSNTVYRGSREDALKKAALAVNEYPDYISKLIVTGAKLPLARRALDDANSVYSRTYRKLKDAANLKALD